jgi:hypothetical protein
MLDETGLVATLTESTCQPPPLVIADVLPSFNPALPKRLAALTMRIKLCANQYNKWGVDSVRLESFSITSNVESL